MIQQKESPCLALTLIINQIIKALTQSGKTALLFFKAFFSNDIVLLGKEDEKEFCPVVTVALRTATYLSNLQPMNRLYSKSI